MVAMPLSSSIVVNTRSAAAEKEENARGRDEQTTFLPLHCLALPCNVLVILKAMIHVISSLRVGRMLWRLEANRSGFGLS